MKIAIVTVYQPFTNLGSFLQSYALKRFLEQEGHSVKFVKTGPHVRSALQMIAQPRPYRSYFLRLKKAFQSLRDLQLLSFISSVDASADCVILGSDEIWNVTNQFFRQPIFWGIGLNDKPTIGYAISAGHATVDDFRRNASLTDNVANITTIFARDEHTHDLLLDLLNRATERVVDPTLLVPVAHLSEEISLPKRKYILVYTYGIDARWIEMIKRFARERDLMIVSPCFWHIWADKTIECSALQFSSLIAGAEYVFTTTFHGAIFALINHSRCGILPLRPKVKNLCETLHSVSRLLLPESSFEEFDWVISSPFAVDEFEQNLTSLREASAQLLTSELKRLTK